VDDNFILVQTSFKTLTIYDPSLKIVKVLDMDISDKDTVCQCSMDQTYVVASISGENEYLSRWEIKTGRCESTVLCEGSLQRTKVLILNNYVRVIVNNPKTFKNPIRGDLHKGEWYFSFCAKSMDLVHCHVMRKNYDYYNSTEFTARGRYFIRGSERSGPEIFEDGNYNLKASYMSLEKLVEDHGYRYPHSSRCSAGWTGFLAVEIRPWFQDHSSNCSWIEMYDFRERNEVSSESCDSDSYEPESYLHEDDLWISRDSRRDREDVLELFASEGIVVAILTVPDFEDDANLDFFRPRSMLVWDFTCV
jgi:hypothetical protein